MKCPDCNTMNPDINKFCRECGSKLTLTCPSCNAEILTSDKFCGLCGHNLDISTDSTPKDQSFDEKLKKIQRYLPQGLTEKILSQRDKIEGERKQVTVMFCDMEGFTSLSEKIGPEEAYSIMDQVYEILIHKVHDFGGTVNEMTGDGIVGLFGAPVALEDAPQRAIRSALAIHREMVKFSDKVSDEYQTPATKMRIGIHTGPVVVGTVGNDLRVEFKAVGDTVNLASRIEKIAEPGTTYITENTFKLTEGLFRFEGLGGHEIKGKEKPIKVYRVLAASTRRTRFDVSSESGLTPFIGREREIELLIDGFGRAKSGKGQVFSIVAEAGLGKSRLLYEFRKGIANEDVTFFEGKCLSYSRETAYHPVIDILKTNFDIQDSDGDLDIRDKVSRGLRALKADVASLLPCFLELLSVEHSGVDEDKVSSDSMGNRIRDALKQITLKSSEIRPLILAIEDLHWIDKSSEEAFKYLLESISGAKILLILTYRPEFILTWAGGSYHNQVTLNRLSNSESLTMLAHLLGTEVIDNNLKELILEKTEGIPFYLEEFVKSLKDLSMIQIKDNSYFLITNHKSLTIPSQIQDVIMSRVDSLPEGAKEVLQTGSVIGREFAHRLIKDLNEGPEQQLLSNLSILKDSELLYERGIYPDAIYIFKHALTQEAVYQSLLKKSRQKFHNSIAQVLDRYYPEIAETQPEILSHHYCEANIPGKAILYCRRAAEISIRYSSYVEAIDHLTKGLELLEAIQKTPEMLQHELAMQTMIGQAYTQTQGFTSQAMYHAYKRAWGLCQKLGNTRYVTLVLLGLRRYYSVRGQAGQVLEIADQLLDLAEKENDNTIRIIAYDALGRYGIYAGALEQAKESFDKVMALYDHQEHRRLATRLGQDPAVDALTFGARALLYLGYPDQALVRCLEGITLARELAHPFSLVCALSRSSSIIVTRGESQQASEYLMEAMSLAKEHKFAPWIAWQKNLQGWILIMQGENQIGTELMRQGLEAFRATGAITGVHILLARLALSYVNIGLAKEGLKLIAEAVEGIRENRGRIIHEAEVYRLQGELILQHTPSDTIQVQNCFQRALEVARKQQAKLFELRASTSLCRLWLNQGKKEEARNLLSEIYGWFTEGFDTADLKDAKALLEELA